jgi:hypothetical protein
MEDELNRCFSILIEILLKKSKKWMTLWSSAQKTGTIISLPPPHGFDKRSNTVLVTKSPTIAFASRASSSLPSAML